MDDEAAVATHTDFFAIYGDFLWIILGAFLFIFFLVSGIQCYLDLLYFFKFLRILFSIIRDLSSFGVDDVSG